MDGFYEGKSHLEMDDGTPVLGNHHMVKPMMIHYIKVKHRD